MLNICEKFQEKYHDKSLPSVKELFQHESIEGKEKILAYLKKEKWDSGARAPMLFRDVVTGKPVPGEFCSYSDGEFSWRTDEIYYFEKYNLKLKDEFIQHVLSQK